MKGFDETTYRERIAERYDEMYPRGPGVDTAVDLLAELSAGGPVLELGVGTGRLAAPQAERGVDVHGIDASPEMVGRLRT